MTKMTVMMPYDSAIPKKRNEPFRYRATDTGNAQRMYDQQGENIRCVIDEKDFALWESEKGIWVKSQDSKMLQTLASGVWKRSRQRIRFWKWKGMSFGSGN